MDHQEGWCGRDSRVCVWYRTYHVGDALGGDPDDLGRGGGAPGLGLAAADGDDEQVLDARGERELALVVEHVRDGGRRGVAERDATADRRDAGGPVARPRLHRRRGPARPRARRGADVAEAEVVGAGLDGVGAREEERAARGEVVAWDQHRPHRVAQREVPEQLAERGGARAAEQRAQAAPAPATERERVLRREERAPLGPPRDQHGREHAPGSGPRCDVEEVGQPGAVVPGPPPQRGLQPDERRAGEQPVGGPPAAVDRQDAHLALALLRRQRPQRRRLPRTGPRLLRRGPRGEELGVVVAEEELALEDGEDLVGELVHVQARRRVRPRGIHLVPHAAHSPPLARSRGVSCVRGEHSAPEQLLARAGRQPAKWFWCAGSADSGRSPGAGPRQGTLVERTFLCRVRVPEPPVRWGSGYLAADSSAPNHALRSPRAAPYRAAVECKRLLARPLLRSVRGEIGGGEMGSRGALARGGGGRPLAPGGLALVRTGAGCVPGAAGTALRLRGQGAV
uniref:Uncharacterized protein n=1 Tax=Setaria italica TaxID=4555 RepID=K4A8Q3_SETIT